MNERTIVCEDLGLAIDDLRNEGFRLDVIYPADEPHTALLSKEGACVRLTSSPRSGAPSDILPAFQPAFLVTHEGDSGAAGRAGMLYRDLIPGRLGGRYIASAISIPKGGLVEDWVHFHHIAVQIIYVRNGWVRVVYEDQGEPFVMDAGDLVLQPPRIRHRVLESSAGLEVIEITAPAIHSTMADHALGLPCGEDPERLFSGQKFLHHRGADGGWANDGSSEVQETKVREASGGLADVRTIRTSGISNIEFGPSGGELVFGFVLAGSAMLQFEGGRRIKEGDAFVIPPDAKWRLQGSGGFRLLHVTTARLD